MDLKYSVKPEEGAVKAMGRDMNVSFKDLVVVADAIRGKKVSKAIEYMESVVELKNPVPYRKHNKGVGHRKGKEVKVGKYPQKAARHVLAVLRNLAANAEYKGYDTEKLKLTHVQAQKGLARLRRKPKGRWALWETQYSHIQMIAKEA
ncbi:MAG: 50S ribosomal protein L22 [Candidatus Altiarchaeales archaeon]|nr:50S ribosomal protein L22 [Candidatus Altiarchaeales archaeon]MBD3416339.1 50S ribosomal protein L22 [Candidatus Altiarchaeales archaeon]